MSADESFENASPRARSDAARAAVGRTLPHSIEAEEHLLSCCLIDSADVLPRCLEARIKPESFYLPAHGIVFERLLDLYNRQQPTDLWIVAEELKTAKLLDQIGGYPFLTQVSGKSATTAQASYFIAKVREQGLLREIIRAATGTVEDCYNYSGGIEEFVDGVERKLFAVTQRRVSDGTKDTRQLVKKTLSSLNAMLHKKGQVTGVPSGFVDLDQLTWGFQPSDMIVLAGRPSMGKTSLALNFAENIAMRSREQRGGAVLIFSLEMSADQLMQRMIVSRARVNMKLLRDGLVSNNGDEQMRMTAAGEEISGAPIFIDDTTSATVLYMRAKARRIHQRTPLAFVMVDYLQLMEATDRRTPREQQVSEASRGLKALAKDLNVPVLVLCQLSRRAEERGRPVLSDLRESGAIEQDADVVLMLNRPKDADDKYQVAADTTELIIAKQRNGPVGDLKLTFLRDITTFENYHQ